MQPDDKKRTIRRIEQGYSESAIADALGVSVDDVLDVVESYKKIMSAPAISKGKKVRLFELISEGFSYQEVANVLETSELCIQKVMEKDKASIKKDPRAIESLDMYKNGASLEEVGTKFGITRERARQITRKQYAYELGYGNAEQRARKSEIDKKYRLIVHSSRGERKEDLMSEKLEKAFAKGLDPQYFDSMSAFVSIAGVSAESLKEHRPDIYNIVRKNARLKAQRWCWNYDACRRCGTTQVKHQIYGYCKNCYAKSSEFKAIQQRSHEKYRDERLEHNRKYAEEYFTRPEVKNRLETEYDERYFGGNRKLALERDDYQCQGCGMPVNDKDAVGRSKVRVWHLKEKNDHSLESLGTYCQGCLFKYEGLSPHNNFGR